MHVIYSLLKTLHSKIDYSVIFEPFTSDFLHWTEKQTMTVFRYRDNISSVPFNFPDVIFGYELCRSSSYFSCGAILHIRLAHVRCCKKAHLVILICNPKPETISFV